MESERNNTIEEKTASEHGDRPVTDQTAALTLIIKRGITGAMFVALVPGDTNQTEVKVKEKSLKKLIQLLSAMEIKVNVLKLQGFSEAVLAKAHKKPMQQALSEFLSRFKALELSAYEGEITPLLDLMGSLQSILAENLKPEQVDEIVKHPNKVRLLTVCLRECIVPKNLFAKLKDCSSLADLNLFKLMTSRVTKNLSTPEILECYTLEIPENFNTLHTLKHFTAHGFFLRASKRMWSGLRFTECDLNLSVPNLTPHKITVEGLLPTVSVIKMRGRICIKSALHAELSVLDVHCDSLVNGCMDQLPAAPDAKLIIEFEKDSDKLYWDRGLGRFTHVTFVNIRYEQFDAFFESKHEWKDVTFLRCDKNLIAHLKSKYSRGGFLSFKDGATENDGFIRRHENAGDC